MNKNKIYEILKIINSMDKFYKKTKNLDDKTKGDLFEMLTFYMFKFLPLLNKKIKTIWLYSDVPNLVLKTLKFPKKDKGIDIILETDTGYEAIQCKFRHNANTIISWSELSNFFGLSFGLTNYIQEGYLVTNTNILCKEVVDSEKVHSVYGNFFEDNLTDDFFKNIKNDINKTKHVPYKKMIQFDVQQECINLVLKSP